MTDPRTFTRAQLRAYLSGMQWREVLERIDSGQLPPPLWGREPTDPKAVWDRKQVDRAIDEASGASRPAEEYEKMLDRALGF